MPIEQWISDPTAIPHRQLCKTLLANMAPLANLRDHWARELGPEVGTRFSELMTALQSYDEKKQQQKRKASSSPAEGGAKRPRPG